MEGSGHADTDLLEAELVLVGSGGVGKTTLLKKLETGEFEARYIPTLGVEVHQLKFRSRKGAITFNVWDTAGQESCGGLRDGYYVQAQGAIIMFDVTSRITYKDVPNWFRDLQRARSSGLAMGSFPIALVSNKIDAATSSASGEARGVKAKNIRFHRKHSIPLFCLSCLAGFNIEAPFLWLAQELTEDPDLEFEPRDVPDRAPRVGAEVVARCETYNRDAQNASADEVGEVDAEEADEDL
eukprot:TRINITY_DN57707_c0_g1_i1.p1 TRINITY_DN57707_c0_g1~~TRINITY_DN57707_c0_g1_i1.p1  ORF type:complete len:240 (+),score=43.75 TRINITY_DN57707_c0_g1_i1:59-778(+)